MAVTTLPIRCPACTYRFRLYILPEHERMPSAFGGARWEVSFMPRNPMSSEQAGMILAQVAGLCRMIRAADPKTRMILMEGLERVRARDFLGVRMDSHLLQQWPVEEVGLTDFLRTMLQSESLPLLSDAQIRAKYGAGGITWQNAIHWTAMDRPAASRGHAGFIKRMSRPRRGEGEKRVTSIEQELVGSAV